MFNLRITFVTKSKNEKFRKSYTRLRLSSHSLEIETGRYNGIDRINRLCKLRNKNVVESEYHFYYVVQNTQISVIST